MSLPQLLRPRHQHKQALRPGPQHKPALRPGPQHKPALKPGPQHKPALRPGPQHKPALRPRSHRKLSRQFPYPDVLHSRCRILQLVVLLHVAQSRPERTSEPRTRTAMQVVPSTFARSASRTQTYPVPICRRVRSPGTTISESVEAIELAFAVSHAGRIRLGRALGVPGLGFGLVRWGDATSALSGEMRSRRTRRWGRGCHPMTMGSSRGFCRGRQR